MRPTTGLKDMFFELDPGTRDGGRVRGGRHVPVANTAPDVNLDEILAALDSDTQAYLRLLLVGAGKGLDGRDKDLGKLLGSARADQPGPRELNSRGRRAQGEPRPADPQLQPADDDRSASPTSDLTELVSSSNGALGAIAEQDPNVQRAVALLPGTLAQATRRRSTTTAQLAAVLGPAFNDLRPFARNLDELNASTRAARRGDDAGARRTRSGRSCARRASRCPTCARPRGRFAAATPPLTTVAQQAQPARQHGRLQPERRRAAGRRGPRRGLPLLGRAGSATTATRVFPAGDGNGFYRRIYLTIGCDQISSIVRPRLRVERPAPDRHRPHRRPGPALPGPAATRED